MDRLKQLFDDFKSLFTKDMGNLLSSKLSDFKKRKLMHEFRTFFDLNKDGQLEWKDFEKAKTNICELSGWKIGSDRFMQTQELFIEIWRKLQDEADDNFDGKITETEWIKMWQKHEDTCKKDEKFVNQIPDWLDKYFEYKFNLFDRTGDAVIDIEEYEYVISSFGVSSKDAKTAFIMFSQNMERKIDMEYFKQLSSEYFRSDDQSALGNFITGKLDFADLYLSK